MSDAKAPFNALNAASMEELRALLETLGKQYDTIIAYQARHQNEWNDLKNLLVGPSADPTMGMVQRQKAIEDFIVKQRDRNLVQDTTIRNIRYLWAVLVVIGGGLAAVATYVIDHYFKSN